MLEIVTDERFRDNILQLFKNQKRKRIFVKDIPLLLDPSVKWYYIPRFPGYEICNYGLVRSLKNPSQIYGLGTLVRFEVPSMEYELSTDNNDRVRIKIQELWRIATKGVSELPLSYPRSTIQVSTIVRTPRIFLSDYNTHNYNFECKLVKAHVPTNKKEETRMARFTIIQEPLEFI